MGCFRSLFRKPRPSAVNEPQLLEESTPTKASNSQSAEGHSQPSLWDQAYETLRADALTSQVLDRYENVLASESGIKGLQSGNRQQELKAVVERKLQETEATRSTMQIGKTIVDMKCTVDKVLKTVIVLRDILSSAASCEPHAAAVCLGSSLILPLILNHRDQYDDLAKGIQYISESIFQSTHFETVYNTCRGTDVPADSQSPMMGHDFMLEFKNTLVRFYGQILEYEARAVCHLFRSKLEQVGRDLLKWDDWASLREDIIASQECCWRLTVIVQQEASQEKILDSWNRGREIAEGLQASNRQAQEHHHSNEEKKVLQALYTSHYKEHKARVPDRVPGTCRWFIANEKYQNWLCEKSGLLWVTAYPGCGKSVLARSLVDQELPTTDKSITCYFFFKDDREEQKSARNALCAILHQVYCQRPDAMEPAIRSYKQHSTQMADSVLLLWELLIETAHLIREASTVCVIDALDECAKVARRALIDALNTLSMERHLPNLKFLVTSRRYYDIEEKFDKGTVSVDDDVESAAIGKEINLVIKQRVSDIAVKKDLDSESVSLLQDHLLCAENRTYLWLHLILCQIEDTFGSGSVQEIQQHIAALPRNVNQAYEKILRHSPCPQKARKALHIVLAAETPLSLREMNMALHIEHGARCREQVALRSEKKFERYLKNLCGLFVTVVDAKVYFLHQTAKEFLLGNDPQLVQQSLAKERWQHSVSENEANHTMTKACLSYLQFDCFKIKCPLKRPAFVEKPEQLFVEARIPEEELRLFWNNRHDLDLSDPGPECDILTIDKESLESIVIELSKHDFFSYAARYWPKHFQELGMLADHDILRGWTLLCDSDWEGSLAWLSVSHRNSLDCGMGVFARSPTELNTCTRLHLAALLDHPTMIYHLCRHEQVDAGVLHTTGRTALHWAIVSGSLDSVDALLDLGANTNAQDLHGRTPLFSVETSQVAKLLFRRGARVNAVDCFARTPLHYIEKGEVIEMLVEHGALINAQDEKGKTPLQCAIRRLDTLGMRYLLNKGASIDQPDKWGLTPLHEAALRYHHAGAVTILIEAGAKSDPESHTKWTPLHFAAVHWHARQTPRMRNHSVDYLIQAGAKVNASTIHGWTPMFVSAYSGRELLLSYLTEVGANPNVRDSEQRTPLYFVNTPKVVQALCKAYGCEVNIKDSGGLTPLMFHAEVGMEPEMKELIAQGAEPNCRDLLGRTALDIVKAKLETCEDKRRPKYEASMRLLEPLTTLDEGRESPKANTAEARSLDIAE